MATLSATSPGDRREKLDFLQVFRALASVMVLVHHAGREVMRNAQFAHSASLFRMEALTFGVDIFFIISGFIMIYTTRNVAGGGTDARNFFLRRLIRIVPVYWLYTTLFLLPAILHPSILHRGLLSIGNIVGSYFFVPVPGPDGIPVPVFSGGWTLNYEMFFYAVFAVVLLAPRRFTFPLLVTVMTALMLAGIFVPQDIPSLFVWTRPMLLEFVMGAGIAELYLRDVRIPLWASGLALVAGVMGWQAAFGMDGPGTIEPHLRGVMWGLPAAAIVGSIALSPALRAIFRMAWAKPIIKIGDSSYSLYLAHMFVIRALTIVLPVSAFGVFYPAVFVILVVPLSIAVGWFSYLYFEDPVHRWGKELLGRRGSFLVENPAQ